MTRMRPHVGAAASIPPGGQAAVGPVGVRSTCPRPGRFLTLAVFSILGLWVVASPVRAASDRPASAVRSLEQGVLTQVNALRRQHGLMPLRLSSGLAAAARQHSTEMANHGYFGHSSANGSSFDQRIAHFYPRGGRHYWSVGENLLWSSPDVDTAGVLSSWLNSPEHRKNMLRGPWREIGLSAVHVASAPGAYGGREVTIVTAEFGARR
jgi:uncharacterized protein YkwD